VVSRSLFLHLVQYDKKWIARSMLVTALYVHYIARSDVTADSLTYAGIKHFVLKMTL
jgi:hypothetical protein